MDQNPRQQWRMPLDNLIFILSLNQYKSTWTQSEYRLNACFLYRTHSSTPSTSMPSLPSRRYSNKSKDQSRKKKWNQRHRRRPQKESLRRPWMVRRRETKRTKVKRKLKKRSNRNHVPMLSKSKPPWPSRRERI